MKPQAILLLAIIALTTLWPFPAYPWNAEVVSVSDGDTLTVRNTSGESVRIRLYGVDCPEGPGSRWAAQPYSRAATNFVKKLLPKGSAVSVLDMGYDKYERTVAGIVSLPDGAVVQEELLRAGLVWVYPKYCRDCRQWKELQKQAKAGSQGLWREENPTPPWEWRNKAGEEKTSCR